MSLENDLPSSSDSVIDSTTERCSACKKQKSHLEFPRKRGERRKTCTSCIVKRQCEHHLQRSSCRTCRPEVRAWMREYQQKYNQNPHKRMLKNLRSRLYSIRTKKECLKPGSQLLKYLGCSQTFMKRWLDYTERQYCDNDANVEIDHLHPLSEIRRDCEQDFKDYFSWKNTRVVPSKVNRCKGKKEPSGMECETLELHCEDFLNLYILTA